MECQDSSLRVELPHEVVLRWKTLRCLYKTLQTVQNTDSLVSVLLQIFKASGYDLFSDQRNIAGKIDWNPFSGLQIFLDEIATDIERKSFFQTVLPVISSLASNLDRCAPAQGLQRSFRQNSFTASLDKGFLASILASLFLCAMPPCTTSNNKTTIDFVKLYGNIQRPEFKDHAIAKLRQVLQYFERIASNELDLSGEVVFERQVAERSSLPSIKDWKEFSAALCPFIVEQKTIKHFHILSSNCKVDVCGCFHGNNMMVEKDASLEALIASVFVEELDDNETLLIKENGASGLVERLNNWIPSPAEQQTGDAVRGLVLRYLNQALTCFDSQELKCKFMAMNSANSQPHYDGVQFVQDDLNDNNVLPNEPKQIQDTDIHDITAIPGIDGFCDSLVDQAYNQARDEIDITSKVDSPDTLESLMVKSLHDVFQKTPEKEKVFSDSIIHSPLLPKCLKHFHSNGDFNSPLVPSTPPSSPAKRGLVKNGRQSSLAPSNPLMEELRLGTKSFADSLAEALMSCVLLSSSLATSIATEALDPLSITSVTMELFQKSPRKVKLIEERQNGRISGTTTTCSSDAVQKRLYPKDDSSFRLLSNQENDSNFNDFSSTLSSIESEEDHEERRQSLNELALNLFENFASKLSTSIIQTATRDIVGDLQGIDEESTLHNASESRDTGMSTEVNVDDRFSDSDSDIEYNDWYDMDKQLEDQLYELDLIDNEDDAESMRTLSDMAEDITSNVLRTAASAAVTQLESPALDDALKEQGEGGIDYAVKSIIEYDITDDYLESNQETIEMIASNMSTNIIQAVFEEVFSKSTSESSSYIHLEDDFTRSSDQCVEIIQYAEVLTEHLLETSIAIASASVWSCDESNAISTSVWSCDEGNAIGVQMEVVLQWLAASAVSCPALTFHTMEDRRLDKLSKVQQTLRKNHLRVCDVLEIVLRYIDRADARDLFEFLLDNLN